MAVRRGQRQGDRPQRRIGTRQPPGDDRPAFRHHHRPLAEDGLGQRPQGVRPQALLQQAADVSRNDLHQRSHPLLRGDALGTCHRGEAQRGRPASQQGSDTLPDACGLRARGTHHSGHGGGGWPSPGHRRHELPRSDPCLLGPHRRREARGDPLHARLPDERPGRSPELRGCDGPRRPGFANERNAAAPERRQARVHAGIAALLRRRPARGGQHLPVQAAGDSRARSSPRRCLETSPWTSSCWRCRA